MAKKRESGFDKLGRLIKSESDDIRKHMAAKDDIAAIRKEMATKNDIAGIMTELADIKRRLKDLEEIVADHAGHSKEIDHALERIAIIEKRLGIKARSY
ncbi:hypothetical protein A3H16_01410 [Candidatus Kaiserbacteria bacterium RIFCSPLOWO2_12_FULL_53_8]|uniref:Uncharacterized protein n=2 Tax=Candidatus Kaiseribacteriota TaxID=1752734 RepID=A0A1F6CX00_9BACT|nr:MAG: hypothetical protein A2851_02190 [Candidatus Kaiserbacteria bacterium RIFCSPHIGHO2_01_FULL_53_29]OGG91368.1 MAG: hypothetical protein A3H16_01410 [Candidatus Kaiserbacteria bacterium RIFCSPLOWO2_12_FULL_53_8]